MSSDSKPLHLKYRPATFSDMVGQRSHFAILQRMAEAGKVPSVLCFSGPSGTGKTSTARILATAVEAMDVIEIDAASNGGVEKVRELLAILRTSTGGPYRFVILDEAQSITQQGFEAFLKTLEEPPEQTIFVLTTTQPHKIPDTIQSRMIEFQFRSITAGDIAQRLAYVAQKEEIKVERDLVLHLANRAGGNLRAALQSLDLAWRAGIETLRAYLDHAGEGDPAPILLATMMTGDHARIFDVLDDQLSRVASVSQITADLIALIRDLFVLKAGGVLPEGQRFEVRKQLASRIDQDRLLLCIKVLWETRTKLRQAEDPTGNLTLSLILMSDALARGNPARHVPPTVSSTETPKPAPRKLSLADMQRDRTKDSE